MRSAIYYPSTEVRSPAMMRSSLLLWDKLHTIVPYGGFQPNYGDQRDMAEAWELIGGTVVPDNAQKDAAHKDIESLLAGAIPDSLRYAAHADAGTEPFELWPQKLSHKTWELLQENQMTLSPLDNGDYPFTDQGGMVIMAKIADACAGTAFARVTDRLLAYSLIADSGANPTTDTEVVPMTLDLIDATSLPLDRLIDFRRREDKEQRGGDYAAMRHRYADAVQKHVDAIKGIASQNQRAELNRQFGDEMARDLKDLRSALGVNRTEIFLKPVVVATVVGAGTVLTGGLAGPAALIAAGSAAIGTSLLDAAKHVAELFSSGLGFSNKQKEAMAKHPMAYMYALSKA